MNEAGRHARASRGGEAGGALLTCCGVQVCVGAQVVGGTDLLGSRFAVQTCSAFGALGAAAGEYHKR